MNKQPPASPLRDFALEVHFSKWEFNARHHLTASDMESLSLRDLLALGTDADREAFEATSLGYTETWGAPDLRTAIAATYDTMAQDNILTLAGAGEGLYALARVLLGPNDHAIVPTPNYQSAETVPAAICETTGVPMRIEGGKWRLDIDAIKDAIRPNTRLISLNFPHNPTGALMPRADLNALITLARADGIYILCDEVYRGVELDPNLQMPQIADVYERGISLNVLSKAYGLPGLRIGWLASPDLDVLQRVERYKHYLSICNAAPAERLGMIALAAREQIFARNRALLRRNLTAFEALLDDFPGLIDFSAPEGGCVAYPRYTGPGTVETFCADLIENHGILLLPAALYRSDLGATPDDRFRIGLGRDRAVADGITALRRYFEDHKAEFAA
ncbi:aminotransferase class I/II-fold pyridoxal phosphate-dependent enzyme [Thalassobacter stenotrophicus]|uniref:Arginine--pyruvate transaminase AruH n=2 Tax=Thalassobacter stenotrophicus TaxID=266809 RepID=A0A0P1EZ20_9RHOB|nr:aminotransferase class I/II-fold pyridoxal phosphate-dependent enzyme [Thalassobacter stenotrophicus]PVZ47672.1 aminotransferase class V-fold PLP-dependent enzyme [Thalassobacter stenotrophicus]CUH60473.1 Arginine--pyruvate transaminase AruH [Thalassobacter stenotrophicus]SHI76206.1 Aspartate/methionine/tyrosine aminotransferase [Thalassobacter stenotrophicus DSM 16310]